MPPSFHLIEPLVVIAIVTIQGALFLPAPAKARTKAQGDTCLNHGGQAFAEPS